MAAYSALGRQSYTNLDVMDEMERSGWAGGKAGSITAEVPMPHAFNMGTYHARDGYNSYPPAQFPPGFNQQQAAADAIFDSIDQNHDGQISREEMDAFTKRGGGKFGSAMQTTTAGGAYLSGQQSLEEASLYADAVDVIEGPKHVINERLVDQRQQVISGVRPIYTYEKVVEIPKTIIKEYEKKVVKPQLIERVIEVPKTETRERTFVGPPTVQYQEQIVEVPQVVFEERVVHVPKKELQERLIEVPKVEYVERIEYDDYVEYREVLVDKVIEVPEIEYHIRQVEHLVPQNYVQEYFVDKYVEMPPVQVIQEVARQERVPVGAQQAARLFGGEATGAQQAACVQGGETTLAGASLHQPSVAAAISQTWTTPAVMPPTSVSQWTTPAVMPPTSVSQWTTPAVMPPTSMAQSRPMQGITVAVPKGTMGMTRTEGDGGQLFHAMDRNHDGTISPDEALQAISIFSGKHLMDQAPPQGSPPVGSTQPHSQPYGSYDPQTAGSDFGFNPYSSSFALGRSFPAPPSLSNYGSTADPHVSQTPPTPPAPYGRPLSQNIPQPVSVY